MARTSHKIDFRKLPFSARASQGYRYRDVGFSSASRSPCGSLSKNPRLLPRLQDPFPYGEAVNKMLFCSCFRKHHFIGRWRDGRIGASTSNSRFDEWKVFQDDRNIQSVGYLSTDIARQRAAVVSGTCRGKRIFIERASRCCHCSGDDLLDLGLSLTGGRITVLSPRRKLLAHVIT